MQLNNSTTPPAIDVVPPASRKTPAFSRHWIVPIVVGVCLLGLGGLYASFLA